jgi:hypothetical protein
MAECYPEASVVREPPLAPLAAIATGIVVSRFVPFGSRDLLTGIAAFLILGVYSRSRELRVLASVSKVTLCRVTWLSPLPQGENRRPFIRSNKRSGPTDERPSIYLLSCQSRRSTLLHSAAALDYFRSAFAGQRPGQQTTRSSAPVVIGLGFCDASSTARRRPRRPRRV